MLDSPYLYVPHEAVIPGILAQPGSDWPDVVLELKNRGVRLESLVDGWNRRVDQKTLTATFRTAIVREEASSPAEVAAWLTGQLTK